MKDIEGLVATVIVVTLILYLIVQVFKHLYIFLYSL